MLVSSIAIVFIALVTLINGKALDVNEIGKRSIGWPRMMSAIERNNVKRSTAATCGIQKVQPLNTHRIVGGIEATPNSWPWTVSIQYKGSHFCGGTLIHERVILTAAHCVYGTYPASTMNIAVGRHCLTCSESGQNKGVQQVIVHPNYNPNTLANDIALLVLDTDVVLGDTAQLACLPNSISDHPSVDTPVYVVGWGTTSEGGFASAVLLQAEVNMLDLVKCQQAYASFGPTIDKNAHVCAGFWEGGKDSCQGDSGGPLFDLRNDNTYAVYGIVSFGYGCARPGYPGVYTRVDSYLSFIKATTAQFSA